MSGGAGRGTVESTSVLPMITTLETNKVDQLDQRLLRPKIASLCFAFLPSKNPGIDSMLLSFADNCGCGGQCGTGAITCNVT